MFAIQKIFNYIIFPPSVFILILIAALFFIRRHKGKAAMLIAADIVLMYALAIEPVKNLVLAPLENYAHPVTAEAAKGSDLVVILGGGTVENSPEEGEDGSLTGDSFKRAFYGLRIAEQYRIPVLYSGGRLYDGRDKGEAEIAVRLLSKYNHSKIPLYKETLSRTTFENAAYVREKFNPRKVILVTSAYHMKRSLFIFRRTGIECVPAPTDYKIDSWSFNVTSWIPKSYEMDCIYKGLKEHAGLLYYRIRYM